MITMTTHHLGQSAGRARLVAPIAWRGIAPAFLGCGSTGVDATSATTSYLGRGITTDTFEPAGNPTTVHTMANKRPARHLGTRST